MKITIKVKGYDKKKLLEDMAKAIDSLMQAHEAEQEPTLADLPVIDWASAPDDAVFHVNDKEGPGWFTTELPNPSTKHDWWMRGHACGKVYPGFTMPHFSGDGWKQTLQTRPEQEVEEVEAFEWSECDSYREGGLKCSIGNSVAHVYLVPNPWKFIVDGPRSYQSCGIADTKENAQSLAEAVMRAYEEMEDGR